MARLKAASETLSRPERAVLQLLASVDERTDEHSTEARRQALADALTVLSPSAQELPAWNDGLDVLGTAYERLLSGAERREAGQFQTPFFAADVMAGWLLSEPTRLLLDPGVGAGRLLFRAGIREDAPDRLLGLDVDPLSVQMAAKNLDLRGLTDRSEVRCQNFLLDDLEELPDAVTCNPPYSRHHALSAEMKAAVHYGFEARGLKLNRLAALHALFLVRALEIVSSGGRLAFITPADWLDVGYGKKVKEFVLANASVEAIILFPNGHLPFGADVLTSAAITMIRKNPQAGAAVKSTETRFLHLPEQLPDAHAIINVLRGATDLPAGVVEVQAALSAETKWGRMPAAHTPASGAPSTGRPVSEYGKVRRGIATGANGFFVLSEQQRQELGIPVGDLRPCVPSPKLIRGVELTLETLQTLPDTTPRWLINSRAPQAETADTPLGDYLRAGRERGIHEGFLTSRRSPWYAPEQREDCAILFTYFNRDAPRFVRNYANAVPLNNWLIIEPKPGVDPDALWRALSSEDMRARMLEARRDYAGMWKLEPKELSAITLPQLP